MHIDQLEATLRASKKQHDGHDDQGKLLNLQNWKRRIFYWDLKPEGYEQFWDNAAAIKETQHFPLPFHVGVARQNGDTILPSLNLAYGFILNLLNTSNFSLREAKRLRISNANKLDKQLLRVFLNEKLAHDKIEPVLRVTNEFVEFATINDTTNALSLTNIQFQNQDILLSRPPNYVAPTKDDLMMPDHVEESENKLVVTNIPLDFNEEQIKELLNTVGPLKAFELEKGPHGHHKGHCYCEYEDLTFTDIAINSLNGMEISNSRLGVQRALFGSKSTYCPAKMLPNGIPQGYPDFSKLFNKLSVEKSNILCLYNLLDDSDVVSDDQIKRIKKDVGLELKKIVKIEIPRPNTWIDPDNPASVLEKIGVPKVFVEFENESDAFEAADQINGKVYYDKTVLCTFYPKELWDKGILHENS
eukprot:NODE_79_length_22985_cov_0.358401.p4 type:complete len:416 gc:universal NODE_79_length_22985_cov_0.358401:14893-13646(-)